MPTNTTTSRSPRRMAQRLLFSLLPVLLLLLTAELALRIAGYQGHPDREASWCREHAELGRPFFRPMALDDVERQAWGPAFAGHPRPFPLRKAPHERRIFVLGGSAAHGYGFSRNGSFSGRLEQLLAEDLPQQDVQVINAGTIAASSQQLLAMSKEILAELEPDLIIIYSGNNELLEWFDWRQYLPAREHRLFVASLRINQRLSRLRSYLWLRDRLRGADAGSWGQTSYSDDQALPWSQRARIGSADHAWAREAYTHNVGRIIEEAEATGVPVILSTVAANWTNQPGWVTDDEGDALGPPPEAVEARERAEALTRDIPEGGLSPATVDELRALAMRACEAWPEASCAYDWGTRFRALGQPEEARRWLLEAVHRDEFPNRVKPAVNEAIRDLARRSGLPLVDAEALLAASSDDGIIGFEQVYDHCHPTLQSHWLLAGAFAATIGAEVWPELGIASEAVMQARVHAGIEHLQTNDDSPAMLSSWLEVALQDGAGQYDADPETEGRERWQVAQREARRLAAAAAPGPEPGAPPARDTAASAWNRLGALAYHHVQADCRPDRGPCLQEAADAFREALALQPEHCPAASNLGWLMVQTGRRDEGLALLDQATRCEAGGGPSAGLAARARGWAD